MGRFEIDNSDPARPRLLYVFSRKVNFSKKSKSSHSKNPKRDEGKSKKWRESEKLELKSSLANIDKIVETVAAFASTKGGNILIGISNSEEVLGVDIGKDTIEKLTNKIVDNTDPKIYPAISTEKIKGKTVIIIGVKESHDKPVLAYNKPFKRAGKSTMKISKAEYERMILEKYKERLQFDKQICQEANLKNINWDFITKFFVPRYESATKSQLAGTSKKLLEALECVKDDKPTNEGILLFGKNPQKFFMNAYIALARYKGKEVGTERLDYKEFHGNLFRQIDECDKYIKEHTAVMSRLLPYKVEREDIPEYSLFSIRELITNAIIHRDYSITGSKVIIKMFDNKIEFYNPGGLPIGITPENIVKKQFSRNPLLTRTLSKIRYIEEVGEGWDKIIKEHKSHPLKPMLPKIEADEYSVLVEIFSTKEKFEKEEGEKKKESIELNPRQKNALKYLKGKRKISNREYCAINKISNFTAYEDLQDLIKKKLIVQKGKGRNIHYLKK